MPKMKTKRAAAKRFTVKASGKIKRKKAYKRHLLTCKTAKSKRQLRGSAYVHSTNEAQIHMLLPYGN